MHQHPEHGRYYTTENDYAWALHARGDVVAAERRAVALVSHKLAEILHATDQVTIMRQGRVAERTRTIGGKALRCSIVHRTTAKQGPIPARAATTALAEKICGSLAAR